MKVPIEDPHTNSFLSSMIVHKIFHFLPSLQCCLWF